MPTAEEILKKYWDYDSFRPLQKEIIDAVCAGRDTLALLPTGGGKSVCFQVPGLLRDGVCIVVTPLIALMKDQVKQLLDRGIKAAAIYTGQSYSEIDRTLDNFVYGDYKFLYVSPERLQTEIFIERVKLMKVGLLAIDEAHCISKWGHDFRPQYLKIKDFRELLPNTPAIALTATATALTSQDILEQLRMKKTAFFQRSFRRENLSIQCLAAENKPKLLAEKIKQNPGSSIVYVRTRKQAVEVSAFLNKCQILADFYHAGLENELRNAKHEAWISDHNPVIVCTNAFGMGIDKPNVRAVYHLSIPDNPEAYYQEIGRAGRDGQFSQVILIYNQADLEQLEQFFEEKYPPLDYLQRIYQSLCNYFKIAVGETQSSYFDFDAVDFNTTFGYRASLSFNALKLLESQDLIELNDAYQNPSSLYFTTTSQKLEEAQRKNEHLDGFVKTILRIYGGELFTNPMMISENEIARHQKISVKTVETWLRRLEQLQILQYKKHSGKPGISFKGYRYDAEKLPLNHQQLAAKKEKDRKAMFAMRAYILSKNICRMSSLLTYFGEETEQNCGICDHCRSIEKEHQRSQHIIQIANNLNLSFPFEIRAYEHTNLEGVPFEDILCTMIDRKIWSLHDGRVSKLATTFS